MNNKTTTILGDAYTYITRMEALESIVNGNQTVYAMIPYEEPIELETLSDWGLACDEGADFIVKAKAFNTMMNVGKAKYVINTFNGKDKHSDGSDFYGIETFSNKVKFNDRMKELKTDGYIEQ